MKNRHQAVVCNVCHMNFMGDTQLKVHVANVHVKLRPFQCPECPKAFPSRNNLRAHMHVHDTKEGGFQCSNCDYLGSSYLALRKHNYASHMGRNYPYECHLCGRQYKQSAQLSLHFRKAHDLGVPEGFHRYTYRLEEGPVFHLKTFKTYEPNAKGQDQPRFPKIEMATLDPPLQLEVVKVEVDKATKGVKVELQANSSCVEVVSERGIKTEGTETGEEEEDVVVGDESDENDDPSKRILTRAARKLLHTSKP